MMYFITTIQEHNGKIEDSRCVGYVDTIEEAREIVKNNKCDIFEYTYNYAIIESVPCGIYQYDPNAEWYKIVISPYEKEEPYYEKINKPKFAEHLVGLGIG